MCTHPRIARLQVAAQAHPRTPPRRDADLRTVCLDCMVFINAPGIRMHEIDQHRVGAANLVRQGGGAARLKIPTLLDLHAHGALPIISTSKEHRIDRDPAEIDDRVLAGLLRDKMRFSRSKRRYRWNYPYAYMCPSLDHPVIVHAGFIDKVLEQRRDTGHVRFAGYLQEAIGNPSEVWFDHEGRDVYRLISVLDADGTPSFMHIVVDAESHIMDTAFVPATSRNERIENYRIDTVIDLRWGVAWSDL